MSNKKGAVPHPRGLIFVLSGPSGSGKTTLTDGVMRDPHLRSTLARSISLTTRTRRKGERHGRDYVFVTEAEFRRRLRSHDILEHTRYLDCYYGTSKERLRALVRGDRRDVLMCLDTRGAFAMRRMFPRRARLVFVVPPSQELLRDRLKRRARDSREELAKRLALAQREIACARRYDHRIINDKARTAIAQLRAFIIRQRAAVPAPRR